MTDRVSGEKKADKGRGLSASQAVFCTAALAAMVLTVVFSNVTVEAMSKGMRLCVRVVIPSLFPFMVLSELLIATGASGRLIAVAARPLSRLLGISREGGAALLLGLVCGFPVGAVGALSLHRRGRISRGELERLLAFCNLPSFAFVVNAVGVGMLGSRTAGLVIYAAHIVSALTVGIFCRAAGVGKNEECDSGIYLRAEEPRSGGGIAAFTEAVRGSAESMLCICAFVIFFSALLGAIDSISELLGIPTWLRALISGFFEMTSGASAAAQLPHVAAVIAAAAVTGWSGLSVHFQLIGICRDQRLSLKPYFLGKAAVAAISSLLTAIAATALGERLCPGEAQSAPSLWESHIGPLWALSVALFLGGCVLAVAKINAGKRGRGK